MGGSNKRFVNKRLLVERGVVKEFSMCHLSAFHGCFAPIDDFVSFYGHDIYKACSEVVKARSARISRCKDKVGHIVLGGNARFITFSFTDEALARTTPLTRRRAVSKCLKRLTKGGAYIANVDYGEKNGREHYHAIAEIVDFDAIRKYWNKWYGGIRIERVRSSDQDLARTTKYINKLTAHAFKDSVHMNRLIYSRISRVAPVVDEVDDVLIVPLGSCAP